MLILGIDPGLNTTGYGIIEKNHNNFKFIDSGFIRTQTKDSLDNRLLKIYNELTEVIQRYKIDAVVLEKLYAHYKHPLTSCLLGHARGIICLVCAQNNISLFEYASTRIKKATVGAGHASKQQIRQMVLNILGIKKQEGIPLDVTDALSLAISHCYILKNNFLSKVSSEFH